MFSKIKKVLGIQIQKRVIAAVTVMALMLVMLPVLTTSTSATNNSCTFGGCPAPTVCGTTAADGYMLISCGKRLDSVRNNRDGSYRLERDINLLSTAHTDQWFGLPSSGNGGWTPINIHSGGLPATGPGGSYNYNATAFRGKFDGNGKTISGLEIRRNTAVGGLAGVVFVGVGLFGSLQGAHVKDLTIILSPNGITGLGERRGGLAGVAYHGTLIENVHVKGFEGTGSPIQATSGVWNYIGGVVGVLNNSTIRDSSAENLRLEGFSYVGGIAGVVYVKGKIYDSSSYNIRAHSRGSYVGGLVGVIHNGGVDFPNWSTLAGASIIDGAWVENATITTGLNYAGGLAGAIYEYSDVSYSYVVDSTVTTSGLRSAGLRELSMTKLGYTATESANP